MGYAHLKFGTPSPFELRQPDDPRGVMSTLFDYVPPASIRQLALEKPDHSEIHDRCISINSRRTHIMTPKFSLASQSMDSVGGHSPPPYILAVRNQAESRYVHSRFCPTRAFYASALRGIPLPTEWHTDTSAACIMTWPCGERISRTPPRRTSVKNSWPTPRSSANRCLLLGYRDQIRAARIGNVDWGGGDIELLPHQGLAVAFDDITIGVMTTLFDDTGKIVDGQVRLAYGSDDRLRLHVRIYGGPELQRQDNPLNVLVFFELKVPGPGETLAAYAKELAGWTLAPGDDGTYGILYRHATPTAGRSPIRSAPPTPTPWAMPCTFRRASTWIRAVSQPS